MGSICQHTTKAKNGVFLFGLLTIGYIIIYGADYTDNIQKLDQHETIEPSDSEMDIYESVLSIGPKYYPAGGPRRKKTPNSSTRRNLPNKTILLWTQYEHQKMWTQQEHINSRWWNLKDYGNVFEEQACTYTSCILTDDKSKIHDADMVLFSRDMLSFEGSDWPQVRYPHQLWVHVKSEERPVWFMDWLIEYDNKINLSMNYRDDADIWHPYRLTFKTPKAEPYIPQIPLKNKTRMAVWPVSHCDAPSQRDKYAEELAKYIDVDIYGKCGNFSCKKTSSDSCYGQFEREYKFYLGFENSICNDYITEKAFTPLRHELIPIVLGGADYDFYLPPHSFINVRDFTSPKELANYLIYLSENEDKYYEYFAWKQNYTPYVAFGKGIHPACKVCEAVHSEKFLNKPAYKQYYDWWFRGCDNNLISRMRTRGKW